MGEVAVFIDRDGTLFKEVGYINHLSRVELLPRSAEAVRNLNEAGLKAVVVTNQAGVARGYFPESLVEAVHRKMHRLLAQEGARLDGVYYCPHHPEGLDSRYRRTCSCRKPAPGMLERASRELGIDLSRSYVVGDKITDIEMAHRVGARGVLVLTGYGRGQLELQGHLWRDGPEAVADDLLEAVLWIRAELADGWRGER